MISNNNNNNNNNNKHKNRHIVIDFLNTSNIGDFLKFVESP